MKKLPIAGVAAALSLVFGFPFLAGSAAHAEDGKSDALNSNKSIWTQNDTQFRKEPAVARRYTKKCDLSDLPHHKSKRQLKGKLRIWGNNYIKDGYLGEYWQEEFKRFQPGIEIEYNLPTTGIGIPPLSAKASDIAMSRKAILMDLLTFEQVYKHPITEISAVTGSYDVYGWMPAFTIVVNKDNPLEKISMKQLDGVFTGARNGGYDGSVWRTDYPYKRGSEENIRPWGQLGLTGEWADKPIHPGGQTLRGNNTTQLSGNILRCSAHGNENSQAYASCIGTHVKIGPCS